jgi:hypothetical protein
METLNTRTKLRVMASRFAFAALPGACLALASISSGGETPSSPMLGFSVAHAEDERSVEQRFDASLNAADQGEWMQRMAS